MIQSTELSITKKYRKGEAKKWFDYGKEEEEYANNRLEIFNRNKESKDSNDYEYRISGFKRAGEAFVNSAKHYVHYGNYEKALESLQEARKSLMRYHEFETGKKLNDKEFLPKELGKLADEIDVNQSRLEVIIEGLKGDDEKR